jgi:hypothetical protein
VTTWTGQAQLLADDIREPGFAAAGLNASAWCARVDPEATHGLVGAALALTSGDAGTMLWSAADPCPDDATLLTAAAELEGAVAELLEHARRMAAACRAEFEAALAAAARAAAAAAAAETPQARADAEEALRAARAVIADCEAALEILDETGTRLAHAENCLRKVPDDLAGAFEVPYAFVQDGGKLPYDGEFLTSGISYEAA